MNTTLIAEDGQAIFIGGLIRNSSNYKRSGVPVLGEIPVARRFPTGTTAASSTETVVVITPRIIRDDNPDTLAARTLRLDDSGTAAAAQRRQPRSLPRTTAPAELEVLGVLGVSGAALAAL